MADMQCVSEGRLAKALSGESGVEEIRAHFRKTLASRLISEAEVEELTRDYLPVLGFGTGIFALVEEKLQRKFNPAVLQVLLDQLLRAPFHPSLFSSFTALSAWLWFAHPTAQELIRKCLSAELTGGDELLSACASLSDEKAVRMICEALQLCSYTKSAPCLLFPRSEALLPFGPSGVSRVLFELRVLYLHLQLMSARFLAGDAGSTEKAEKACEDLLASETLCAETDEELRFWLFSDNSVNDSFAETLLALRDLVELFAKPQNTPTDSNLQGLIANLLEMESKRKNNRFTEQISLLNVFLYYLVDCTPSLAVEDALCAICEADPLSFFTFFADKLCFLNFRYFELFPKLLCLLSRKRVDEREAVAIAVSVKADLSNIARMGRYDLSFFVLILLFRIESVTSKLIAFVDVLIEDQFRLFSDSDCIEFFLQVALHEQIVERKGFWERVVRALQPRFHLAFVEKTIIRVFCTFLETSHLPAQQLDEYCQEFISAHEWNFSFDLRSFVVSTRSDKFQKHFFRQTLDYQNERKMT